MGTAAIVVDREFRHRFPQMAFMDRNERVEAFAADGADRQLAPGIRRGCADRGLEYVNPEIAATPDRH